MKVKKLLRLVMDDYASVEIGFCRDSSYKTTPMYVKDAMDGYGEFKVGEIDTKPAYDCGETIGVLVIYVK